MIRRLLLVGGGGHCLSVLDSVKRLDSYTDIAVIAPGKDIVNGVPVIGNDSDLPALYEAGWGEAIITLGSIGNPVRRRELFEVIREIGMRSPVIIDPSAVVTDSAYIGDGTFVGKNAIVNADASVGCCAIINSGAIVEHGCEIGDYAHISPGAILCGGVKIDNEAHIGAGAVVKQGIHIGKGAVIGMGSVVLSDISENVIAYGNPCRIQRSMI